ncbi:MAG: methyl-accepting chemotaxis protein [Spirochaetaceae bacterium]
MTTMKQFPAFRLKILLTLMAVLSVSFVLTTLAQTVAFGLMHEIVNPGLIIKRIVISFLSYGMVPGLVFGGIMIRYLKPVHDTTYAIFNNEEVKDDDRKLAIKRISKLSNVVWIINMAGYNIGFLASTLSDQYTLREFVVAFILNLATASIFSFVQINLFNLILAKARSLLKIYYLDGNRSTGLIYRNMAFIIALSIFISFTFITAGQEIYESEEHYLMLTNRVLAGELTIDQARDQYKKDAAAMLDVSPDRIKFPFDMDVSEKPKPILIYLVYFIDILLIAGFIQYTLSLFQVRQINDLSNKMKEISEGGGDLTKQVEVSEFDEVGVLTNTINVFLDGLRTLIKDVLIVGEKVRTSAYTIKEVLETTENATIDIVRTTEQTANSTKDQVKIADETTFTIKEMLNSVKAISENVEIQSSFVEQTSSAITQMSANIDSVNQTTNSANRLSKELVTVAAEGGKAVNQSIVAVKKVESYSEEINKMVSIITKIAAQTNLLAMNAAIEAAHAGDSGRGFAVVALEVRKLAEDSSGSAKQISNHIKEMVSLVNDGVHLSEGAGQALGRVGDDVNKTSSLINEVSSAMDEQAVGAKDVLGAITSLVESTQSIRSISNEQQEKNVTMNRAIEALSSSFKQIEAASLEQSEGTKNIQSSITDLKNVILDNEAATTELDNLLKGFIL